MPEVSGDEGKGVSAEELEEANGPETPGEPTVVEVIGGWVSDWFWRIERAR